MDRRRTGLLPLVRPGPARRDLQRQRPPDRGPQGSRPAVLKVASPHRVPTLRHVPSSNARSGSRRRRCGTARDTYDAALRNWAAKAGAHLERQRGRAARAGGGDGTRPGLRKSGAPGPTPGNQAPSVTQQESNGFVRKVGVEIPFAAEPRTRTARSPPGPGTGATAPRPAGRDPTRRAPTHSGMRASTR